MSNNLLLIINDYYPSSRATSVIMQRLAEGLVKNGFSVSVLYLHIFDWINGEVPPNHKGVDIVDWVDVYDSLPEKIKKKFSVKAKKNDLRLSISRKIKSLTIKFLFSGNEEKYKINKISTVIQSIRKCLFIDPDKKLHIEQYAQCILYECERLKCSTIISVLGPMDVHVCVAKAKGKNRAITWLPFCLDPYAFDQTLSDKDMKKRLKEELLVYKSAEKIFMLSEAKIDHQNDWIADKTVYFDLPNIRNSEVDRTKKIIEFDSRCINCVFLGNFYWSEKLPEYMLELFASLTDGKYKLYLIGEHNCLSQDFLPKWKEELGEKLQVFDRIGQEEAKNVLFDADVLINLGHGTSNQCPSKLIDYFNTGKPIISISRIKDCTSLRYVNRYPNKLILHEKEHPSEDEIKELALFLKNAKQSKPIEHEKIEQLFSSCTNEILIEKLMPYIQ